MSDDLVKRARHNALADMPHFASVELIEALADRIEELEAEAKIQEVILDSIIEGRNATFVLMLERAETAEAKLAKAVGFIRRLERFAAHSKDAFLVEKAQDAFAELTGGTDGN